MGGSTRQMWVNTLGMQNVVLIIDHQLARTKPFRKSEKVIESYSSIPKVISLQDLQNVFLHVEHWIIEHFSKQKYHTSYQNV